MSEANVQLNDLGLQRKFEKMTARVRELGRVLVAYSGGIDSTLVLKVGTLAIGENCIGVTAKSETLTDEEFTLASEVAREHGMRQETIAYSELDIESYADNPVNRCYFCKHELYRRLDEFARRFEACAVLDGSNADDLGDYRPGLQAVKEFQVVSILREAEMRKHEIRQMARELGLRNWDKPSGACLSSRIPYGERIDPMKLRQIAEGEAYLRSLGFLQVRLRHHDKIARLEVESGEIARLAEPEVRTRVVEKLRALGFQHVTMDLAGYRTGSLSEHLLKDSGAS